MGYVALLLSLLFYVYSVAAVFLFGATEPVHFESLPLAMLSLFRVVTREDWTDVMYIAMYGCDNYGYGGIEQLCTQPQSYPVFGALLFVTFMLLGAMVILNLFIGVIMGGMDEAKKETELEARSLARQESGQVIAAQDVDELLLKLGGLTEELELLKGRLERDAAARAEAAAE